MCGRPVQGAGDICAACQDELGQPTTSFSPVVATSDDEAPSSRKPATPRPFRLLVTRGPHVDESFYLDSEKMSIGRDPHAELFLNDRTVSREHANINRSGTRFVLRDADSLNGTYVNGKIVDEIALEEGDEIQIGTFHLLFTSRSDEDLHL
ncbi:MAG: FHA domain-containing protein [Actinomycetia bacterium]|nr:FHA domain-containing protein [Actinomycetes bacterium]